MKVTLSIRTKICPPLTRDRARLVARMILPEERRVLVSGGNKTYLTFKGTEVISLGKPAVDQGLMRVRLETEREIAARETLTRFQAARLAGSIVTTESIVRLEGGKYTYLSILENRKRSLYRLGKCRMCSRDTLGSSEYCHRCLPVKLKSDELYYGFPKVAELMVREVKLLMQERGEVGEKCEARRLRELVECIQ